MDRLRLVHVPPSFSTVSCYVIHRIFDIFHSFRGAFRNNNISNSLNNSSNNISCSKLLTQKKLKILRARKATIMAA